MMEMNINIVYKTINKTTHALERANFFRFTSFHLPIAPNIAEAKLHLSHDIPVLFDYLEAAFFQLHIVGTTQSQW